MKLPLSESINPNYLYVTADNVVHFFMPIVSGTRIGLDNTCKAVYALQEFFGKSIAQNNQKTAQKALEEYKLALENDLSQLPVDSSLIKPKQERLEQIKHYLAIVKEIEKNQGLDTLSSAHPSYPTVLEGLLQDMEHSNVAVMTLRPSSQDSYIRMEAANPVFSVAHDSNARGRTNTHSTLQKALIQAFNPLVIEPADNKQRVINSVIAALKAQGRHDFPTIQATLQEATKVLLNQEVDFTKDGYGKPINEALINAWMGFDSQTSPQEYIEALLGYCANTLFEEVAESPFNRFSTSEEWSIGTQFLLAMVNIHCAFHGISARNFGQVLDDNASLSQSLASSMAHAQKTHHSAEDTLFEWLNQHTADFGLEEVFFEEDQATIKKEFTARFSEIHRPENPHLDEFLVLNPNKKGYFKVHQGSICASFADFAASPILDLPLTENQKNFLTSIQKHFKTLDTDVPYQNPLVKAEIDIDLSTFDTPALQALYDKINTYTDKALKAKLVQELKQERPDFNPQIDAKGFLTLIAEGKEPEAEQLLKGNPDIAQELLKAHNIPFTDYQGRTFKCTAYEYAYWAKDTYMCRMLEKYMDNDTKREILRRIEAMEKASQGAGLFQGQKGLIYTDIAGKEHCSVHFDLNPLVTAYENYFAVYDDKVKTSRYAGDWGVVDDAAWLKIGMAQRDCPAHVIQEYCHKTRSFYPGENKDTDDDYLSLFDARNTKNLTRGIRFSNLDTGGTDDCYPLSDRSGLGFSNSLLRGGFGRAVAAAGAAGWLEASLPAAVVDRRAIKALDVVRTADLRQSHENLKVLSDSPVFHSGGI